MAQQGKVNKIDEGALRSVAVLARPCRALQVVNQEPNEDNDAGHPQHPSQHIFHDVFLPDCLSSYGANRVTLGN